ncbi:ABC transporter permease [Spirochaeta dissipatitropha]
MKKYIRELLKRRDLIITLVESGLKSQHKNTMLGYIWWVLDPLLGVLVYYFLRVVLLGLDGENIEIFLAVGLVTWTWIKSTIPASTKSISKQASLINKVYLPKILFPLCLNLTQMVNFFFSIFVVAGFMAIFGIAPTWHILWFPYIVIIQFLFLFSISTVLAYIGAFVRDIENVITHIMRFWFYGSPVIWETGRMPPRYSWIVDLNPASTFIGSYRSIFMHGEAPNLLNLHIILGASVVLLCFMTWFYSRNEHKIIKAL